MDLDFDLTSLTNQQAAEWIPRLLMQIGAARNTVEIYQRKAAGIRKMIAAVVEIYPDLEDLLPEDLDNDEEPRPRGAEAVRRVLFEREGEWFPVAGVVNMLDRFGWMPESSNPSNAVRTALERLVERGVVQKSRAVDGAVIYRAPQPPPPPYSDDEEPF